jgi:hypothetical protein
MSASTLLVLTLLGALIAGGPASAACRWFGTQFDCRLGASQLVIGTQTAPEPSYARSFRPRPFHGGSGLPGDHAAAPAPPLRIELQNVDVDPSLCRRIGNETYCY